MRKIIGLLSVFILMISCSTSTKIARSSKMLNYGSPQVKLELLNDYVFKVSTYSDDSTYGFTQENPIMVGGPSDGPQNERRFLNALVGPNGEELEYERLGSCCNFITKNGIYGNSGLLDMYEMKCLSFKESVVFYINMYDSDTLKIPVGFKSKY